jgi:hypothetical protein
MDELVEGSFLGMDPVDVSRCKAPDVPQLHAFERCLADVGEVSAKHMWDDSCRNESMAVTHALNQQADLFGSVVGWSEADQGVHRRTHKLGKACVLKLAVSASGASANKAEYGSWRAILATENPDFVKLFVPTRKIGPQGAYIVSKRVTPLDVFVKQNAMTHREADRYVIQMEEALDRAGASCSDLKSDNVGIDEDGQPRILDYGFGVRCPVNPNPEGRPRPPPGQPVRPAADSRVLFHCRRRVTNRPFSSLPL